MVPERPPPGMGLLAVAGLSAIFALSIALAGLATRDWDVSRFVTAGDDFADRTAAPPNLFIAHGPGFDGQFFYRLALDPFTSARTESGITLDDPAYRQQRILYPFAAWLLSWGHARAAAWALVGLNVAALTVLGVAAALLMRSLGRPPLSGLVVPLFPGLAISLWRDTSEILAVLLVLSGLVALRRERPIVAAAFLTAAVLARETTVVVPVALGVSLFWSRWRDRPRPAVMWPAVAAPFACFIAWQAFLRARWGRLPIQSGKGSTTFPLSAALRQLRANLDPVSLAGLRHSLEMLVVLAFLVWVVIRVRGAPLRPYEALAFVLYAVLGVLLAGDVWAEDWGFLRVLSEAVALGALVVLSRSERSVRALVMAGAALWLLFLPSLP